MNAVPQAIAPAGETDPAIRARGLTRRFGHVTAVDQIDLDIPRARIYGFLGPNGSGKSTTIRMLCGLLQPSAGTVNVLGHEMPRDAEPLRTRLGYMTQKFSLWDDLTVSENLQFMGQVFGLPAQRRRARVAVVVEEFDLASLFKQRAGTLSGGQRQRLALARAILVKPRVLVLDDTLSALDIHTEAEVEEALRSTLVGVTGIVVAHRASTVLLADRVAMLVDGRIAHVGTHHELLATVPEYRELLSAETPA